MEIQDINAHGDELNVRIDISKYWQKCHFSYFCEDCNSKDVKTLLKNRMEVFYSSSHKSIHLC